MCWSTAHSPSRIQNSSIIETETWWKRWFSSPLFFLKKWIFVSCLGSHFIVVGGYHQLSFKEFLLPSLCNYTIEDFRSWALFTNRWIPNQGAAIKDVLLHDVFTLDSFQKESFLVWWSRENRLFTASISFVGWSSYIDTIIVPGYMY